MWKINKPEMPNKSSDPSFGAIMTVLQHLHSHILSLQDKVDYLMSTQVDLLVAMGELKDAVVALESKTPTPVEVPQLVDQPTLDQVVTDLAEAKARIDAETAKK